MLKNNKGVTLIILIITIIIIVILSTVTITTSTQLIKNTKNKAIKTNMILIKAEVQAIYDEYQFSQIESALLGTKVTDLSEYGIIIDDGKDLWYSWDRNVLASLGLDPNMLLDNENYIVNYATGEVIYTSGIKNSDDIKEYTLTDML